MSDNRYKLTEEHKAQLKPWTEKWIKNAMSCERMTSDDKIACAGHVAKMYESVGLKKPDLTLFVPSPFAACIVGGFGAAIAELGEKSKFTIQEMYDLVLKSNTSEVRTDRWYRSPYDVKALNKKLGLGKAGLEAVKNVHNMWNGGNQLSGWLGYVTFFRYIAKVDVDFTKWDAYEQLGVLSGPRIMHNNFCIISDRPTKFTVNATQLPHCEDGPFCEWTDGCSLYSYNGVRGPSWIISNPELITVENIEAEANAEVRRVMIDKFGKDKFVMSAGKVIHTDDYGTLYRKDVPGDVPIMMVKVVNSTQEPDGTYKDYWIRVDPEAYGGVKTAQAAVASTWRNEDGSLLFKDWRDYVLEVET